MGNTKTYSYFDLIGIKDLIDQGEGYKILSKFWKETEIWTDTIATEFSFLPLNTINNNQAYTKKPTVYLNVLSDSAILYTQKEYTLEAFYRISLNLKDYLSEKGLNVYCIINKDEVLTKYNLPALGGRAVDNDNSPLYNFVVDSGPAWVNIYFADRKIRSRKDWHDKYTLYCVKAENIFSDFKSIDSDEFKGYKGSVFRVHCLKKK